MLSEERIKQLLEIEKKEIEKKKKHYAYMKKRNAMIRLLANKAIKANLTITKQEVEDFLAKK
jgi:hypothetical protein